MSDKQVKDYDKFVVRFPEGMRDAIAERAKANGRSMNSEIVQILQDALQDQLTMPEMFPEGVDKSDDFHKMVDYINRRTEEFKDNLLQDFLEYSAFFPEKPPVEIKKLRQKKHK